VPLLGRRQAVRREVADRQPLDPDAEDAWQARLELAQAKIQARDGDLADLPPASRRALLADRNRGVEILVERGLLVDVDVEELSQRPLGELAGSEGRRVT
jgi:hypothetical protein